MPEVLATLQRAQGAISELQHKVDALAENRPKRHQQLIGPDEFVARLRKLREVDDLERDLFLCLDKVHPTQQVPHRRFIWSQEHREVVERDPKPMLDLVTQICCALYGLKMVHGAYGMELSNQFNVSLASELRVRGKLTACECNLFSYQYEIGWEVEADKMHYEDPEDIAKNVSFEGVSPKKQSTQEKAALDAMSTQLKATAAIPIAKISPPSSPKHRYNYDDEPEQLLIEFDNDGPAVEEMLTEVKSHRREDSAISTCPALLDICDGPVTTTVISNGSSQTSGPLAEHSEDELSNLAVIELDDDTADEGEDLELEYEPGVERQSTTKVDSAGADATPFGTPENGSLATPIECDKLELDGEDLELLLQKLNAPLISI